MKGFTVGLGLASLIVMVFVMVFFAPSPLSAVEAETPEANMPVEQPGATAVRINQLISDGGYAYHLKDYERALRLAEEALRLEADNKAARELKRMAREAIAGRGKLTWSHIKDIQAERMLEEVRRRQIIEPGALRTLPKGLRRAREEDRGDDLMGPARRVREANREILNRLEKTVAVDFKDATLDKVAEFMSTIGNVNVMVDPKAVIGGQKAADTTVSFTARNIKLINVLKWVCRNSGLYYTVRDQVVLITTKEGLEPLKITGVYNVSDIIAPIPDFNSEVYFNLNLHAVSPRRIFDWYSQYPYWYYQDCRPGFGPFPLGVPFAPGADSIDRVRISQPDLEEMIDRLIENEEAK